MDRPLLGSFNGAGLVHGLAHHVHDAPQSLVAHGHRDRLAGVDHLLPAHQPFGRVHGDSADGVLAQMLSDLEHQPVALIVGLERVQDLGQIVAELDVDHRAHDLTHMALGAFAFGNSLLLLPGLCDDGRFLCHCYVPSSLE